jgi:plastocyanin
MPPLDHTSLCRSEYQCIWLLQLVPLNRFAIRSVGPPYTASQEGFKVRRLKLLVPAIVLVSMFAMAAPAANSAVVVKGVSTSSGFRWKPKTTNIVHGTKVTWKAITSSHTVTAYKGSWSKNTTINQGQSTSFTFNSAGVYKFRCRFHSTLSNGVCSGMCGKVVVS